jgi:hypothetical protein
VPLPPQHTTQPRNLRHQDVDRQTRAVAGDRVQCRKRGDDVRVAAFKVPEVVQVAVGQDDEAAVLGLGVFARLLFADKRIFVFGFGFEDKQRKAFDIEQEKVDEAFCALLEVGAERVQVGGFDCDTGFEANVCRRVTFLEKTPVCQVHLIVGIRQAVLRIHFTSLQDNMLGRPYSLTILSTSKIS